MLVKITESIDSMSNKGISKYFSSMRGNSINLRFPTIWGSIKGTARNRIYRLSFNPTKVTSGYQVRLLLVFLRVYGLLLNYWEKP